MIHLLEAGGGLGMLFLGGDWTIRGASSLAARFGISELAIGLTVVAFGTSAPELVVSVYAGYQGSSDIALGNIVGSNIANIGLILGVAALFYPLSVHTIVARSHAPIMLVATVALLAVVADGTVTRLDACMLLAGLAGYTAFTIRETRRKPDDVGEAFAAAALPPSRYLPGSVARLLAGLLLLVFGGQVLVAAATRLAEVLAVPQVVIGVTIVATGTSLPEAAATILAARRGQGDIAIGNVVGSNVFNVLGILGLAALVRPLERGGITWVDLGTMVAFAGTLGLFLRARPVLGRAHGAVFLIGFLAYTTVMITLAVY